MPLLFASLVLVVPLVWVIALAIQEKGFGGIADLVSDTLFVDAVERTLFLAAVVTAICLVLGGVYAIALVVARPRLRILLFLVLFVTFWISLLVRTYGWIILLQPAGALEQFLRLIGLRDQPLDLLQTTVAMYPGMVHIELPYMVLPLYAALSGLDHRQVRAAQSLGAGAFTILRRIVLPAMRNGAIAGVVIVFISSLGFFVTPAFLGGPGDLTLGTIIDYYFSQQFDFGAAAALGAVLLLGTLLLYALAERAFDVKRHWQGL